MSRVSGSGTSCFWSNALLLLGKLEVCPGYIFGEGLARFTPGGTRGGVGILWGVVLLCEAALVDSLLCWRGVIWVDIDNLSLHRKTNQQYAAPEYLNPPTALQGHRKRINLSSARSTCWGRLWRGLDGSNTDVLSYTAFPGKATLGEQ